MPLLALRDYRIEKAAGTAPNGEKVIAALLRTFLAPAEHFARYTTTTQHQLNLLKRRKPPLLTHSIHPKTNANNHSSCSNYCRHCLEADSRGSGASSVLDCGVEVAAERQRAATSLFLLTGCTSTPHSRCGTVASSQQQDLRCLTGSPGLQPRDARFRVVALPQGQSTAVVRYVGGWREPLSSRGTPVTTMPAAKDRIVDSGNDKTLYEQPCKTL